jgi:hypothetical protein
VGLRGFDRRHSDPLLPDLPRRQWEISTIEGLEQNRQLHHRQNSVTLAACGALGTFRHRNGKEILGMPTGSIDITS